MGPIGSRVRTPSTRTDRLKPAGYARLMWLLPRQHGSIRSGACIYARQSSGIHLTHVLDIGCVIFADLVRDPLLCVAKKQKHHHGGWCFFLYHLRHPGLAVTRAAIIK